MAEQEAAVGVGEIARLLGVSASTVYMMAERGDIPSLRVGSRWRFFPSQVTARLEHVAPNPTLVAPTLHSRRLAERRRREEEGVKNLDEVGTYLESIDPHGRMNKTEAAEAVFRRFPQFR